jgi:hypothetical protein
MNVLAVAMVQVATKTALAESGNLFDSQNCTWGTFGNILCCVTCHKPTVLPHPKNQQVCMKSLRAFNYAADFVSTDQFRIEHNACSLGLLPGFSLECAVPDPLFLGPIPSWYRAYREGVVAGDRLKDGDHIEFCAKCLCLIDGRTESPSSFG